MAKSEKDKQMEKELKKYLENDETIAKLEERIRQLKARKADAESKAKEKIRKARTHKLCTIAGDIEKIFGHPLDIESDEYKKFLDAVRKYVNNSAEQVQEKEDEPFQCYFEDEDE